MKKLFLTTVVASLFLFLCFGDALAGIQNILEAQTAAPAEQAKKSGVIYLPLKYFEDIKSFKTLSGHSYPVNSVAVSPDGRTLASWGDDNTVRLWDIATGNVIKTLSGHSDIVLSVAFSPDGRTLASGSRDKTVRLWDIAAGNKIKTLSGHSNFVNSVAFSSDGRTTLASGSGDNTVRLWDIATGNVIKTLSGHSSAVDSVAISPDGRTLASRTGDNTVRLWDIATGNVIQTLSGHSSRFLSVAFSPDGRTFASWGDDNIVRLWDIATGNVIQTLSGHSSWVDSIAFSPDGRTLASGSGDNTVRLWDIATGNVIKTLSGHSGYVFFVAFSPDGRTLTSGSWDKTVRLWDIANLGITEQFKKDEFESTDEYMKRVKAIEIPYSTRITLGSYDADKGGFNVVLGGKDVFVPASREKARELSANKENVYMSGTLKYHDKDSVELADAKLTLDASVAKRPVYAAKRPVYVPKVVPVVEEKPVYNVEEIPNFKAHERENDIAVVIGVEKYQDIQAKSDFSASDAGLMKDYLKALGFRERNIQFMTNEKATRSSFEKTFEAWLPNRVKKGSSVFVYFSGHGAPNPANGDGYMVPYDGDPGYLEQTAYSLRRLTEKLSKLEAREVIVLLDSCFSGAGGRSVLAKGARPLVMQTDNLHIKDNIVMVTATRADQISMSSPEKGHGLFTYHFLKALKDGKKDVADIYTQLKPLVEDEAKELNAAQSPLMTPAPETVKGKFLLVR